MIINEMKCIDFPFVKKKNFGIIGLTLCLVLFLPFLSNRNKSQQNKYLHFTFAATTQPCLQLQQIKSNGKPLLPRIAFHLILVFSFELE
jgi:hypothetical protein